MSNTYKSKDKNVKSVTLIMTEKCNLQCTYCYEQNKSPRSMSVEIAKKIIELGYEQYFYGLNMASTIRLSPIQPFPLPKVESSRLYWV